MVYSFILAELPIVLFSDPILLTVLAITYCPNLKSRKFWIINRKLFSLNIFMPKKDYN